MPMMQSNSNFSVILCQITSGHPQRIIDVFGVDEDFDTLDGISNALKFFEITYTSPHWQALPGFTTTLEIYKTIGEFMQEVRRIPSGFVHYMDVITTDRMNSDAITITSIGAFVVPLDIGAFYDHYKITPSPINVDLFEIMHSKQDLEEEIEFIPGIPHTTAKYKEN